MDTETTRQVLAVVAAMLIGAVAMAWVLYVACRPARPAPPVRSSEEGYVGRRRALDAPADPVMRGRLAPPGRAQGIVQVGAVAGHRGGAGGHRYPWPTVAAGAQS